MARGRVLVCRGRRRPAPEARRWRDAYRRRGAASPVGDPASRPSAATTGPSGARRGS